jgi:oligopeptidase A
MMFSDRRELRQQMYEAFVTRASDTGPDGGRWDNGELMVQILALRSEMVQLLGFASFADYALADRMATSVAEVNGFLDDLVGRTRALAQRELDELRDYVLNVHGLTALEAWDIPYYAEKLKQSRYAFNDEDVRPYFPLPRVLEGLFDVAHRLFGVTVKSATVEQVWHPDVSFFHILDADGELRGRFFLDLYARKHKRGGAWMADCIGRCRIGLGALQVPAAFLTCNFPPPVDGEPSLLAHDDVVALFHEFGHGLHHLLTQVDELAVAGINGVPWDAVELPSQFLENWCWEGAALAGIAGHYQTGEPLPAKLLGRMRGARNFQSALQMVRQLEFSVFDLGLHGQEAPATVAAIQQALDQVRARVAVIEPPSYNRFQNSFSHIFAGGYAAGYYSYKWAEVLSADAFGRFQEEGIFNAACGADFLHLILEAGGVNEPLENFVAFRGREPTVDALLHQAGLDH